MEADITCATARWANGQDRCWPGHREANPRKIESKEKRHVALRQTSAGTATRWANGQGSGWPGQWQAGVRRGKEGCWEGGDRVALGAVAGA